jgi:Zn-dependent protease with chaperone function
MHPPGGLATVQHEQRTGRNVTLRGLAGLVVAAVLSGCAVPATLPPRDPVTASDLPPPGSPEAAARTFVEVVDRVVPVAEGICRQRTRNVPCGFRIAIDDRPGQPPNAFQTLDDFGNPVVAFTISLLADVRNADELAFVMGHEAAHHIAGHIPRQRDEMMQGALVAGTLATLGGGDSAAVRRAQDMGAQLGARRFSKEFELEADALGTEIAWRAGFDPVVGAEFFRRIPDPGDRFLGTHPPNAQRFEVVRQTMRTLQ